MPAAEKNGYAPDFWITPDSTGGIGRPYPYMIFRNMEALKSASVAEVMKVGDTVSDIREGKNAGAFTVGVIEGSSEMALTEAEYDALSEAKKRKRRNWSEKNTWKQGRTPWWMTSGGSLRICKA